MKKIFSTMLLALAGVAMMAQQPVLTFEKTTHDFGKVEESGKISTVFNFKNEGMSPLIISHVQASCGCTTPEWTKEPVEPGQTGAITVTYNTNGRPGGFQKTVTITSNATEPTKKIYIKGEVLPKQAKPANKFPVAVGAINMKTKTLDLGVIKKGELKSGMLEYSNINKEEHQVQLTNTSDPSLVAQLTLETIKEKEIGQFQFALDTKKNKLYGKVEFYAYVVVDGNREISDTYKLTIKAEIVEDFSNMNILDKQNAPIIEVGNEYDLGTLAAGKRFRFVIPVKNSGYNPLEIRRVYCSDSRIVTKGAKAVKSGKKSPISLEINTADLQPGKYSRQIVIISNDYEHSQKKVNIKWTIE